MKTPTYQQLSKSRWVAITAIMSALALVGNYVLVVIPNVELGSGVLFVTSFLFGFETAVWCVFIVSIIYAFFNPWGPFIPGIWITQLIGWIFLVITGAMMGKNNGKVLWSREKVGELAVVGFIATLFFDLITTVGYSWSFSIPYMVAVITGLPFIILHVTSNTIIFPAIVPRLDRALKEQLMLLSENEEVPS